MSADLLSRRKVLCGFGALIAAPALVRAASLMPVRGIIMSRDPASIIADLLPIQEQFNINMVAVIQEMLRINRVPPYYLKREAFYISHLERLDA